jgi:hypothetical protein
MASLYFYINEVTVIQRAMSWYISHVRNLSRVYSRGSHLAHRDLLSRCTEYRHLKCETKTVLRLLGL